MNQSRLRNSILNPQLFIQKLSKTQILISHFSTERSPQVNRARPWHGSMHALYRRIDAIGEHKVSIVPIFGQWIKQGRNVDKSCLHSFIKELRKYKRYSLALEICTWMTDKSCLPLSHSDAAIRLDLITKVHGIEQAENYFREIPYGLRGLEVHTALLNCYAYVNSVDKAEAVMQKIETLGLSKSTLSYNILLNLYYRTGNYEKLDFLMLEIEEKGIAVDNFTYGILISANAATSNMDGIGKILDKLDSDSKVVKDWTAYSVAANAYAKAGLVDKALAMLRKSEGLIATSKKRQEGYDFLLTQYVAIGKKEELFRLWERYKENENVSNRGYMSIITSMLNFDDIESAKKIFNEWETRKLGFDIRIPNFLIGAYSRKGFLEKAEVLMGRIVLKGQKPNAWTWYYLATGYIKIDKIGKAVEAMKEAILVYNPAWRPSKEALAACLKYLKGKGNLEEAVEFLGLLKDKDIIPLDIHVKLIDYVEDRNLGLPPPYEMKNRVDGNLTVDY